MELKRYQKKVINQLERFLALLNDTNNVEKAYEEYWNEQNILVGFGGIQKYKNTIKNTPNICFKVPTGGGKTFLACSSIKPVFTSMPFIKSKVVVWLVPSNPILEQTLKNLKNVNHPYRQKIDTDFNGRVEVYTKEQLLAGQNFNPTSVNDQLSVLILSYDSIRSNKKDGRKIYQENGNLEQFTRFYNNPETLIEGIDNSALIQVINQLAPLVIVDESHNATSDLSVEMIKNLNPSFVIDLTATPKENSNIISYVDAIELKKENMVKLPVIVYNRNNQKDVIVDSIDLRNKLEKQAVEEEKVTGKYIRPIVLFQAQPRGKENNETFEKLKEQLINIGIPKEEIAIKTSDINELKDIDLLSTDCKIRYIITVNALKEGWDCPFAYILATLANKTSRVDVEQILGRILRLPYTKRHANQFLNMSYVITSSNDFRETLDNIVIGLNNSGFSKSDYRIAENLDESNYLENVIKETKEQTTMQIDNGNCSNDDVVEIELFKTNEEREEFLDINFEEVKISLEEKSNSNDEYDEINTSKNDMLTKAMSENLEYEKSIENLNEGEELLPIDIKNKVRSYKINKEFINDVEKISIHKFFIKSELSLFNDEEIVILSKERLSEGFVLNNKDTDIDFETVDNDVVKVDIEGTNEAIPKYTKLSKKDLTYFKEYFSKMPQERKVKNCKEIIYKQINRIDTVDDNDLKNYINRVVDNMTKEQIESLESYVYSYSVKIKKKINKFLEEYVEEQFEKLIEQGDIIVQGSYAFDNEIHPMKTISTIPKSLYSEEDNINNFEYKVINEIVSLDNVKWWHRNIEKKGFCINGFINHYPDFIVMMTSGKIVMVETKGDHLENEESRQKVKLGRAWQHESGNQNYRYYMVFDNKNLNIQGAYQFEKFMEIIKKL